MRRVEIAVLCLALAVLTISSSAASSATGAPSRISAASLQALLVEQATAGRVTTQGRAAAGGGATRSGATCGETPGLQCTRVDVPLDRTGATPGTISLHVEVLPADGTPRGVLFLIAGGPGQGSAHVYGLGDPSAASLYRFLFPGYTLVAYDDRGTGDSGLLDCPSLQGAVTADAQQSAATACANVIGATRAFYSTAEHAEDLEAVRLSLGVDKVALFGVSYGTKLAIGIRARPPRPRRPDPARLGPPSRGPGPVRRQRAAPASDDARRVLLRRRLPRCDELVRRRRGGRGEQARRDAASGQRAPAERKERRRSSSTA